MMGLGERIAKAARALALVCGLIAGAVGAAQAEIVRTENVEAQLHSARAAALPGETFDIALRLTVRPGWHTYWINPGDSGLPTTLAWRPLPGGAIGDIRWPPPKPLPLGPLTNYGYEGETLYPISITLPADAPRGGVVRIEARGDWLVCEEICIAEGGELSLAIPIAAAGAAARDDSGWAQDIAVAAASVPQPDPRVSAQITAQGAGARLTLAGGPFAGEVRKAHFFPFDGQAIDHAADQGVQFGAEGAAFSLKPGVVEGLGAGALGGVVTYEARAPGGAWTPAAVEIRADPGPGLEIGALAAPAARSCGGGGGLTWPLAIAFAFLGGLILNVMPCVLPVLSLKALALARGGDAGEARRHGLWFLGGVMGTFLALGGVLIGLAQAGAAAGWGFQLQEPAVVGALALLFFLIGLNLLGVFEVGAGVQNVGAGLAHRSGDAGAFFTGALAVVAAAPCTAPFMAGAMGFAAAQPPVIALSVFAALALGFAAPMTALSLAPALRAAIPKPGPWMEQVKQLMAFPMFAAAVWLAWVLAALSGADGVLVLLTLAAAIGFGLWGWRAFAGARGRAAVLASAAILAAAVAWTARPEASALTAEPWSAARVASLRAEGRPVLVNFTADWCVTCKVNERTSLSSPKVAAALAAADVAYLKGDWTARDDAIAAELAAHGRNGVPLYLFYPAGGGGPPRILPQILTESLLIETVGQARRDNLARTGA